LSARTHHLSDHQTIFSGMIDLVVGEDYAASRTLP
jgi:hypothetical protein